MISNTFVIFLVLYICHKSGATNCPSEQVAFEETDGSSSICCLVEDQVFNCPKDSEIVACTEAGSYAKCVKCQDGLRNSHVSSIDTWTKYRCFNDSNTNYSYGDCALGQTVAVSIQAVDQTTYNTNCPMPCLCNVEKCFHGNTCGCSKKPNLCGINEEMNNNGECEPCGEFRYKLKEGCGPCMWNVTQWRLAQTDIGPSRDDTNTPAVMVKIATENSTAITTNKSTADDGYKVITTDKEMVTKTAASADGKDGQDEEGMSTALIIAVLIIVVLIIVAMVIALCFIARRKHKAGNDTSRLVICYKRFRMKRRQELSVPVQEEDPEAPQDTPLNGDIKPVHHVPQMQRGVQVCDEGPNNEEESRDNGEEEPLFADMDVEPRGELDTQNGSARNCGASEEQTHTKTS